MFPNHNRNIDLNHFYCEIKKLDSHFVESYFTKENKYLKTLEFHKFKYLQNFYLRIPVL